MPDCRPGTTYNTPHTTNNHAAMAAPPGIFVPTGVVVGPACLRSLNQKAVNHTFEPGVIPLGKVISTRVRPVLPSNFQSATSSGGVAPTKLKTDAPSTPPGLPRR